MTYLTRALTLSLVMLIAATSLQKAQARAVMATAIGQVVLCTGLGTKIITLDAKGNPIEVVQDCPDCMLTLMAEDDAPGVSDPQAIQIQTLAQAPVLVSHIGSIPNNHPARAPPHDT